MTWRPITIWMHPLKIQKWPYKLLKMNFWLVDRLRGLFITSTVSLCKWTHGLILRSTSDGDHVANAIKMHKWTSPLASHAIKRWSHLTAVMLNASTLPVPLPLPLPTISSYRKRGRPKGAKSKATKNIEDEPPCHCVGRPLGSGPKQREQVLLSDQGIVKKRKPVGRPRKHICMEVPSSAISLSNGHTVSFFHSFHSVCGD